MKELRMCVFILLALALMLTPLLGACAAPAEEPAQPIELSISHMFPDGDPVGQHLARWANKIKVESNGRLTCRIYPGGTLTSQPETYDGTIKGVCDIGAGFRVKPVGNPINQYVSTFMTGCPNAEATSRIQQEIYAKFEEVRAEWTETKILWMASCGPLNIHSHKPIRTLEDLEGLEIRTPGKNEATLLAALGATPVSMPTADLVVALEKGTVDATLSTDDALKGFKFADVLPYTTVVRLTGGPYFMAMNWDRYDGLSPSLQKVIDDSLEWGAEDCVETYASIDELGIEYATSVGHEFITLSPAELEKWYSICAGVQDEWAADLDAQGYPGTELLQYMRERVNYYTE